MTSQRATSPLIGVDELAGSLDEVTVLDVRYVLGGPPGHEEFVRAHVPGARFVDLDTDLAGQPGEGGRHPLPAEEVFEVAMRRAGVSADRPVVVYDDWEGRAAARAWWLLRFHGHADVRLLDGGWRVWLASGHPVESGDTAPRSGSFTVSPTKGLPVVDAEEVLGVDVLVDARAAERFRGDSEPVDPVAGHIPGAVNVPTTANVDADGRFRSAAALREVYAAAGVRDGATVAAYCGSGVTACHDVLALELAGFGAALYPGSWSGWITDPDRPVARGE